MGEKPIDAVLVIPLQCRLIDGAQRIVNALGLVFQLCGRSGGGIGLLLPLRRSEIGIDIAVFMRADFQCEANILAGNIVECWRWCGAISAARNEQQKNQGRISHQGRH